MDAADCVRSYKALIAVKRAFRTRKTVDPKVRPIHHELENRVRGHIFLCMLACHVKWHMRQAWRVLTFGDQKLKRSRDPVAPAKRPKAVLAKTANKHLEDGSPVHISSTLMAEMSTILRNTCRTPGAGLDAPSFDAITLTNSRQACGLERIQSSTAQAAGSTSLSI